MSRSMTLTRRARVFQSVLYARRYLFMQDKPQVIGFLRCVVEKDPCPPEHGWAWR
jgi:hypothetical protein